MAAEIKIVLTDDTPRSPGRGAGGGAGGGSGGGGGGGGGAGGGGGGEPTEADRRHSYGFRVRNAVKNRKQTEADRRHSYGFRMRNAVKQKKATEAAAARRKRMIARANRKKGVAMAQANNKAAAQRARQAKAASAAKQAQNARLAQVAVTAAGASGPGKFQQVGGAAGAMIGFALGGPIGAAVGGIVGDKVGEALDDPFQRFTKALKFAGRATELAGEGMARVASNDGIGAMTNATTGAAEALEAIPFVGKVTSQALKTFAIGLTTAEKVVGAFTARARELDIFNGKLATSFARQDVAFLKADIREARMMGDSYAKLVDKVTELTLFMREVLLPIKGMIVDNLPAAMDLGVTSMIELVKMIEMIHPEIVLAFGRVSDELEKARRDARALADAAAAGELLDEWLKGVDALDGPFVPPMAAAAAGPPAIVGIPGL